MSYLSFPSEILVDIIAGFDSKSLDSIVSNTDAYTVLNRRDLLDDLAIRAEYPTLNSFADYIVLKRAEELEKKKGIHPVKVSSIRAYAMKNKDYPYLTKMLEKSKVFEIESLFKLHGFTQENLKLAELYNAEFAKQGNFEDELQPMSYLFIYHEPGDLAFEIAADSQDYVNLFANCLIAGEIDLAYKVKKRILEIDPEALSRMLFLRSTLESAFPELKGKFKNRSKNIRSCQSNQRKRLS